MSQARYKPSAHIDQAVIKITRRLHDVAWGMFDDNDLLQDGIIRQVEIIGEAAARLSDTFQEEHPKPRADTMSIDPVDDRPNYIDQLDLHG